MKGVLLVGHGTKNENGINAFLELHRQIDKDLVDYDVQYCFIEFAYPEFSEVIDCMISGNCCEIYVLPIMLFDGVHTLNDIPGFIEKAKRKHLSVDIKLARCIGVQEEMIQACVNQIQSRVVQNFNEVDLLFVGVGSSQSDTNEQIALLAKIVADRLNIANLHLGFMSKVAQPYFKEVIQQLSIKESKQNLLVLPYILFPGRYIEMLEQELNAIEDVQFSGHLDQISLVKKSVLNRFNELLTMR